VVIEKFRGAPDARPVPPTAEPRLSTVDQMPTAAQMFATEIDKSLGKMVLARPVVLVPAQTAGKEPVSQQLDPPLAQLPIVDALNSEVPPELARHALLDWFKAHLVTDVLKQPHAKPIKSKIAAEDAVIATMD